MPRPEIINVCDEYVPDHSLAITAARVIHFDGTEDIIELFESSTGTGKYIYDFRGLPRHLENLEIACNPYEVIEGMPKEETIQRRLKLLFEYAIGSRQHLWPEAEASTE